MKKRLKQRWLLSLLCSIALPFNFFLYGTIDIFSHNSEEFGFALTDFALTMLLMSAAATIVVFAILIALPKKVYPAGIGLFIGISVMCLIQTFFLNTGISSLSDKITVEQIGVLMIVLDSIAWVAVVGGCTVAACLLKKVEWMRIGAAILMIVIVGMGVSGTVTDLITYRPAEDDFVGVSYLSTDGLYEVAPEKNVIIFLIDRFDAKFKDGVEKEYPDFFDSLGGFTYFSDNLSEYSATYPSVCHIITGEEQDFTRTANEYFSDAYGNSRFFEDLKANDFSIRIYSGSYYAYRDKTSMTKYIDNAKVTGHYIITDGAEVIRQMLMTSAIRCVPSAFKPLFPASCYEFKSVRDVEEEAAGVFQMDDPELCRGIMNGISVSESEHKNGYAFYHFNGCHYPYTMDENCLASEESSSSKSVRGCFKAIYSYIDRLKQLGLYENATIIITGDHSAGSSGDDAPPVNGTALFFKPAGRSGEPLEESDVQVCDGNMLKSIIQSVGITTENDYGKGYFEISEEESPERTVFHFTDSKYSTRYTVTGAWRDKDNWTKISESEIDGFYK